MLGAAERIDEREAHASRIAREASVKESASRPICACARVGAYACALRACAGRHSIALDRPRSTFVRVRPPSHQELEQGYSSVLTCTSSSSLLLGCKPDPKQFTFDHVFDEASTQADVFEKAGKSLTEACLLGYNATLFVYGQVRWAWLLPSVSHSIRLHSRCDGPGFCHPCPTPSACTLHAPLRSDSCCVCVRALFRRAPEKRLRCTGRSPVRLLAPRWRG